MRQKFEINDPKIYLRNGSILTCYPLAETDKKQDDTNRLVNEDLFGENVFLFLANADLIFSDSRMFLADTCVHNGMAYSGGFKNGCLGAYLEWWIYYYRYSIDRDGRPIWFLSGSPLSGSHACLTADEAGKRYRAKLQARFLNTCRSFVGCCKDYYDAMSQCQAFTIQEVIEMLKDKDNLTNKERVHTMLEYFKMDNEIQSLRHEIEDWRKSYKNVTERLQQLLFEKHHDELVEYYNKRLNLLTIAKLKEGYYKQQRIALRKQLRSGQITNKEYQQTLTPLRAAMEEADWVWRHFSSERLGKILGEDYGRLHPKSVDSLIKQQTAHDTETDD